MKPVPPCSFCRQLSLLTSFSFLLGVGSLRAQNQTISGDLNVTGSVDINGPVFNLGTWANDTTKLGLNITYAEDATTHAASLSLITTRPITQWQWLRAKSATDATVIPQMVLSGSNALIIYDTHLPTPNAAIVLDPGSISYFYNDVFMYGAFNKMPNQELDDDDSVLTLGLADDRYVLRGSGEGFSLGSGATAVSNSTALGANSQATGPDSTALSFGAHATKQYAVALGSNSAATGVQSTALGAYSAATGESSLTLGFSSLASQWGATSIGFGSRASGVVASAFGSYSIASGDYSVTLGYGSVADASLASAIGSQSYAHGISAMALGHHSSALRNLSLALGHLSTVDAELAVGLGYGSSALGYGSTALGCYSVAKADYSGSIGQTEAGSVFEFVVGKHNVLGGDPHAWVSTDNLFTVGNGGDVDHRSNAFSVKKNGDTTVSGTLTVPTKIVASNVTVSGALVIQPQGDLSMGDFTAQPSPAP